ncbi:hypothetical protein M501DRAFT_931829 [Patellaria atrata CBS 101060]|uniref:Distal membrane-arm assembly complex protein 1-like domain-containing protein n=1 Tax=Patellaria atrata CBS 101060 TaxID=1346257 RepID=A0A9P4SED5_9PEZI|nr:hypothetical protein M501DRAFT_931829 [Patellaria atrata CBS 101060]
MAKDSLPTLAELQKPDELSTLLKQERRDYDCTPCRVLGATAFLGLGFYTFFSSQHQMRQQSARIARSRIGMLPRQVGIGAISATLVGLGVYRLVN